LHVKDFEACALAAEVVGVQWAHGWWNDPQSLADRIGRRARAILRTCDLSVDFRSTVFELGAVAIVRATKQAHIDRLRTAVFPQRLFMIEFEKGTAFTALPALIDECTSEPVPLDDDASSFVAALRPFRAPERGRLVFPMRVRSSSAISKSSPRSTTGARSRFGFRCDIKSSANSSFCFCAKLAVN